MTTWNLPSCSLLWMLASEIACALFIAFASPGLAKCFKLRNSSSALTSEQTEPHTVLHIRTQTRMCTEAEKAKSSTVQTRNIYF